MKLNLMIKIFVLFLNLAYIQAQNLSSNDTQAPTAPQWLSVERLHNTYVRLYWEFSADNIAVHTYEVYDGDTLITSIPYERGRTSFLYQTIEGLSPGTKYQFNIRARDEAGNLSEPSNTVSVKTHNHDYYLPIVDISDTYISRIQLGDIDKKSGVNDQGNGFAYSDFTETESTTLAKNVLHSINITPENKSGVDIYYEMYLDGQVYLTTSVYHGEDNDPTTIYFNIPPETSNGTTRLRVIMRSNETNEYLEIEDYTIHVTDGVIEEDTQAPTAPQWLSVERLHNTYARLYWEFSADNIAVHTYEVYDGDTLITSIPYERGRTSFLYQTIEGLSPGTKYQFNIRARDEAGNLSEPSNTVSVKTHNHDYYLPIVDISDTYISRIQLGDIDKKSGVNDQGNGFAYSDFTETESTTLAKNVLHSISITPENKSGVDIYYEMYLDGQVYLTTSVYHGEDNDPTTIYFNIPPETSNGTTRLRVIMRSNETNEYLEIEDYTIHVTDGVIEEDTQAPTAPQWLSVERLHNTYVRLYWEFSADNIAVHTYEVYDGDTLITSIPYERGRTSFLYQTIEGLSPGTKYQFNIRARDEAGNLSEPSNTVFVKTHNHDYYLPIVDISDTYISRIQLGDIDKKSGVNDQGNGFAYSDFTKTESTTLAKNVLHSISITPENKSGVDIYYEMYLDGQVYLTTLVYHGEDNDPTSIYFNIPPETSNGTTRLRVIMRSNETNAYLEIEDYTVHVTADPLPTCDDGIQNGDETGVDCGGNDCVPCINDGTVVYVDMEDEITNSISTWNPFRIEVGDEKYFAPWFSGNTLRFVTYGKDLICEGTTSNVSLIGEDVLVDASSNFVANTYSHVVSSSNYTNWNGKSGYIGFTFMISGETHYGWFYVTVANDGLSYTIKDYAYNTAAGQGLVTKRNNAKSNDVDGYKKAIIYPNPFTSKATIDVSGLSNESFTMTIYNVLGKMMYQKVYSKNTKQIVLDENRINQVGNYYIKITSNNTSEYHSVIKR